MKVVWTDAEVNKIENTAYMTGIAVGEHMERERIIGLLEGIVPGSGIMGDGVELAIKLIKGDN